MGVADPPFNPGRPAFNRAPAGGLTLETPAGRARVFDQCLVTTSPALLARLAPVLPPDYLKGLLDLKSMGAVVMVLALKHQLSEEGYYWYNIPKSAGFPFLALVEHTNFCPGRSISAATTSSMSAITWSLTTSISSLSQDELLERFLPLLPRFNPAFKPDWVRKTWLFRTTYAQPVPLVNHSQNIPAIQTPLAGLVFCQHEPGVSLGPRHQLCGRDWPPCGPHDAQ